jgi:hypothetical protein
MSGMSGILSRKSRDRVFVHTMTEIQLISLGVVLYELTVKYAQNSLNPYPANVENRMSS